MSAWRRRARPGLGTLVEVAVFGADEAAFLRASERALARIADFHAAMSFHEPASDLSAIADAAAGDVVRVTADTWRVLRAALDFEAETGGLFNVAVAPALVASGALPSPLGRGARAEMQLSPAGSAMAALRLEAPGSVRVLQPVWIDLGGIAKGAAVDAAIEALRDEGAAGGIVNAGGDIAVFGDEPQAIRVRGPAPGRVLVDAGMLEDGAIATSAPDRQRGVSALVSTTGEPAVWGDRSVSVVAATCGAADALTKLVALLGPAARPYLRRHGARAFSIDSQGRVESLD